jgi:hypothetical protein
MGAKHVLNIRAGMQFFINVRLLPIAVVEDVHVIAIING